MRRTCIPERDVRPENTGLNAARLRADRTRTQQVSQYGEIREELHRRVTSRDPNLRVVRTCTTPRLLLHSAMIYRPACALAALLLLPATVSAQGAAGASSLIGTPANPVADTR